MDFDYTHLTPYEPAARIYCGMQDQDPDEPLRVPHPMGLAGVEFTRPAWHFPAENMISLSQMLAAMNRARLDAAAQVERDPRQGELFPTGH